jgi:hypothetical protein
MIQDGTDSHHSIFWDSPSGSHALPRRDLQDWAPLRPLMVRRIGIGMWWYIYMYVYMYVCIYIYVYVYIYMYIYMYMYTCYKFTLGKYIDGHIYLIYWCWLVVFMFHIYIGWFDVFLVSLNVEDPCLFVWRWTFWPKNICARAGEHRTTTWFNSNHIFYPECFFTPSQTCLSTYRITYVQYIHHEAISQPRCIFQTKVANKTSCQPRINVNPWAFQFGG